MAHEADKFLLSRTNVGAAKTRFKETRFACERNNQECHRKASQGAWTVKRLQAFKFELMPNGEQEQDMRRFAGARRFVYNRALDIQRPITSLVESTSATWIWQTAFPNGRKKKNGSRSRLPKSCNRHLKMRIGPTRTSLRNVRASRAVRKRQGRQFPFPARFRDRPSQQPH